MCSLLTSVPGWYAPPWGARGPTPTRYRPRPGSTPSVAADKVEQILSGRYDSLHGRFLHAKDDLDAVMAAVAVQPDARLLRLVPAGEEDPIISYAAMTTHRAPR